MKKSILSISLSIMIIICFSACGSKSIIKKSAVSDSEFKTLSAEKILSFGGSRNDYFNRIIPLNDGGYLTAGNMLSKDGDCEKADKSMNKSIGTVCRYNKDGKLKWSEFFGEKNGVFIYDIGVLSDGNIIIVGESSSENFSENYRGDTDAILIKLKPNGKTVWKKFFGGNDYDTLRALEISRDGGFYACGKTNSNDKDIEKCGNPENDGILVKFDSSGNKQWIKTFGGTQTDDFYDLCLDSDENIFVLCNSDSVDGDMENLQCVNSDCVVIKYTKNGDILWSKSYSHSGASLGYVIKSTKDNGCIFAGCFEKGRTLDGIFAEKKYYDKTDCFLMKLNSSGDTEWINTFGGFGSEDIRDIIEQDFGYLVLGNTNSTDGNFSTFSSNGGIDVFVKYYEDNGEEIWTQIFGGTNDDGIYSSMVDYEGNLYFAGYTSSSDKDFKNINYGKSDNAYIGKFVLKS